MNFVRHVEERFQPLRFRLAWDALFPPQITLIHTDLGWSTPSDERFYHVLSRMPRIVVGN